MKYTEYLLNVVIIILFVTPLIALYFDFKNSFHDGIITLIEFGFIALAVVLKSKYFKK